MQILRFSSFLIVAPSRFFEVLKLVCVNRALIVGDEVDLRDTCCDFYL